MVSCGLKHFFSCLMILDTFQAHTLLWVRGVIRETVFSGKPSRVAMKKRFARVHEYSSPSVLFFSNLILIRQLIRISPGFLVIVIHFLQVTINIGCHMRDRNACFHNIRCHRGQSSESSHQSSGRNVGTSNKKKKTPSCQKELKLKERSRPLL